jgi:hypothetical protein
MREWVSADGEIYDNEPRVNRREKADPHACSASRSRCDYGEDTRIVRRSDDRSQAESHPPGSPEARLLPAASNRASRAKNSRSQEREPTEHARPDPDQFA